MELVRGEPLSTLIARGPLDPEQTLRIMEQSARALQAAHERGFVHRDVKPGNILLRTDGMVKLTDFGIAKAADAVPVTRSGMVMGTAHYIAPEQASGAEAGPAGDVYSLGIVGLRVPGRAPAVPGRERRRRRDDAGPRPPPPLPDTVPERRSGSSSTSILVKDPARRYGTGGEFAVGGRRRAPRRPAADPRRSRCRAGPSGRRWRSTRPARRCTRPSRRPGARRLRPGAGAERSPISSPGMAPARPADIAPDTDDADAPLASGPVASATPPGQPRSHRARNTGSHRSESSTPRPVPVHTPLTEPLRIPPARGPGRGLLLRAVRAAHPGRGGPRGAPAPGRPR